MNPVHPPAPGAEVERDVVLALSDDQRRMISAELAPVDEAQRVASQNIGKLLRFLAPEFGQPGSTLQFDLATGQLFRPAPVTGADPALATE